MNNTFKFLSLILLFTVFYGCASASVGGSGNRTPIKGHGHAYLEGKQSEEPGYGLYSYLLFESPPTENNRNLYLQSIIAVIKRLQDVKALEDAGFDRTELNVTYVPVKTPLPKGRPSPEWVLEHYNYPRSQFFLSRLPGTYRRGPYLVSVLRPISRAHGETGSHLVQNLSAIPPNRTDFIHKWIREFMERAGLPEKWNEATGAGLADELRLAVAQAAEGLPKVQEAIKSWIVWIKKTHILSRLDINLPV